MSQVDLQDLHKIDQKRKDTVYGYIRNDKLLKDTKIPEAVILICIIFFGRGCDEFDPKWKGKTMTLSKENRRVEYHAGPMSSIYCKKIIESGYHEWKFKIIKTGNAGSNFTLGLWRCSDDKDPPLSTYFTSGKDQGFGFSLDGAKKTRASDGCSSDKYGAKVLTGDIVTMMVDFNDLSLCFKVNETFYGKSHDITKDKYRAAMFMSFKDRIVEIMD